MPSFLDGSVNILGLQNPGVYVDNILPTPFITGVPTNVEGLVGVGQWGPTNAQQFFSNPSDCAATYGVPVVRPYDLPSYVQAAVGQGSAVGFCGIRVTDGTDTAATSALSGSAGTMSARYTGSLGSQIAYTFQKTTMPGAYSAIIAFPGRTPEIFSNIQQAIAAVQAVPGTGFMSVPQLLLSSAPTGIGAIPATAQATLQVVGTPAVAAGGGGSGHAVNDVLTLGAGVTVKVLAVTAGAITSAQIVNPGSIVSGVVPSTVGQQVSTTGAGTGASFTLVWGLGPATFTSGYGYAGAPTIQVIGGGGTGGSYTAIVSFWAALASAINNGIGSQRGRSNYVVFSAGIGTAQPTLNAPVYLTGGTDGAAGVGTPQLIGVDVTPRTGMYALRKSGCADFALCDLTDPTTCPTQIAFGESEAMLPIFATAQSDTIQGAVAARANNGIDSPWLWFIEGDWPTVYDTQNAILREVSPQAIAVGLLGNLSPEQSPINKPLTAVVGTQSSLAGISIDDTEESQAQVGGIDLIGKSDDLGATYFSFLTGRNASSNTAANGVEYTRLTNFLTRSLQSAATRSIVGKLQSNQVNDPTKINAAAILNSFLQNLTNPAVGSGGYGLIQAFSVQCDNNNNPLSLQQQGFLFAFVAAQYLNTVRYFVIKLQGGGNVTVSSSTSAPSVSALVS